MNTVWWSAGANSAQVVGNFIIANYPSGEPLIKFSVDQAVDRILLRPKSMLDLMGGLWFIDALVERGHSPPELILPFVPGARQDRLNDSGDYLFTAKSVAKEVNLRCCPKVTVIDPHSDVIASLIDRCHVIHAHECLEARLKDFYGAVVSPDAGAEKRAGAVAKKLGLPLLHGWKTRSVTDGSISGFGLEPIHPLRPLRVQKVLVVDDLCDGGGTFVGLAAVLKERGLKADLWTTHGIYSKGPQVLTDHYENVMCTDSIDHEVEDVHVAKVCMQLLDGRWKGK